MQEQVGTAFTMAMQVPQAALEMQWLRPQAVRKYPFLLLDIRKNYHSWDYLHTSPKGLHLSISEG